MVHLPVLDYHAYFVKVMRPAARTNAAVPYGRVKRYGSAALLRLQAPPKLESLNTAEYFTMYPGAHTEFPTGIHYGLTRAMTNLVYV